MKETPVTDTEYLNSPDPEMNGEEVYLFPASFGQKRLWFLDQFEPNSPYYNIPTAFRLKGAFNIDIFRKVITAIAERHETLRTTFTAIDGEPMQVISPEAYIPIETIDISSEKEHAGEQVYKNLVTREARRPFDLAAGPLIRITVIKRDKTDHVIILNMHHIISDGWSMGVLINEISTLYGTFSRGESSPLEELPIQYADYSEWQKEYLQGELLQKQLDFWKTHLGAHPPVLELPTDRPRPLVQSNVGSSESIVMDRETTDRLYTLLRQEGATLFMVLLSAFKILLYRYSGQSDICIGTPIANRTRGELEGLIGLFINTIVLRTAFSGETSFRDFLQTVKTTTLDAFENQDLPFEYLVDQLQPDRDMSYPPLFQVMFILQNAPIRLGTVADMRMDMLDVDMGTSTFDVTMSVAEGTSGLDIAIEYNTDLFDKRTIKQFLSHYKNLLIAIMENPDQKLGRLPILSPSEHEMICVQWNATQFPRDRSLCIHQLFEERVRETPEAVAVVCNDQYISYGELNRKANQLARYLSESGAAPEIVVGILLEKSLDLMVAVLGALKANAAYLPLDPTYPQDRLEYMLEDARVPVLITQKTLKDSITHYNGKVIVIDEDRDAISIKLDTAPAQTVSAENTAYLIYTSGSTGKSKGTMVRHGSLVNAYLAWEEAYELRSLARNHLQMASFSFDVFAGDWTRALCSGGKLVLVPRDLLLQAGDLYGLMRKEKVNIAEFVPAVLRNLIQYLDETGQTLDFFRNLVAGSDIWYVGEYRKFLKYTGPDTRLINSFGLTEATIDSSYFESRELDLSDDRLVPIGKPFGNMTIYILDAYYQPVPIGVRGELFVGGEGLARGYLNRPDLTAERFIPDPFAGTPGERLYATGDVGRYLADGNIEFLGRADHQVKLRGFRIEPGEIETALSEHPHIKAAAVSLREDSPGDKRLIGYFVTGTGMEIKSSELKSYLADHLPEYMVPSAFMELDELPLTPNGKVDRKALPKPDRDTIMQELQAEYVAPRTPVEEAIAEICTDILNIDKVGSNHNFFDLGGHSLLATQLVSRIKKFLSVEIQLRSVFETPTIAGLATAVEKAKMRDAVPEAPPMKPVPRDRDIPLSFAQQRIWFLDRLEPNSPFYNIPEAYRIGGPLEIHILERSINEIIRRHESLRTTFHEDAGTPLQKFHDVFTISLPVTDISDLNADQREAELRRIAADRSLQAISLDSLPLFRIDVVRLAEQDHAVIMVMHHIVSDNWSTQIMMTELAAIYDFYSREEESPLAELPLQYADFAYWQRNWLKGEVLEKQLDYWRRQLAGIPPTLELPTDRPRPAMQTFNGSYKTFKVSHETSRRLIRFSHEEGVTAFMTLLAAFQTLLYRYTLQDDISVGSPVANRNREELESIIGFFVNTLVLRTDLSGNPSFRELVLRVRETALGAYAHQDVPFEKIVDAVQPERNMSHSPLFQVMFVIQNVSSDLRTSKSRLTLTPLEAHSKTAKFDLTLFMIEDGDNLSGAFEFNTDLFDESTIDRAIDHFQNLLKQVAETPDVPVSAIDLLSREEKDKITTNWNAPLRDYDFNKSIIYYFEQAVQKYPDAIAVQSISSSISYKTLNARINQLAGYLFRHGAGPEVLVGLHIRRSVDMIIAILGILKTGAAYVPLDPSLPAERFNYILDDSGVKLLLTEQALESALPGNNRHVIIMDKEPEIFESFPTGNPGIRIHPEQLAYMIYTSGSTGKPKGTLVTHRGLTNYLNWCMQRYPLDKGRGSLVHSTLAFDATVTGLFTPFLTGKTVTLVPEDDNLDALARMLLQYRDFSLVKITPAHLELLSRQLPGEKSHSLSHAFVIGGENLLSDQITFWQKNSPETSLINEYGPTETVVGCIVFDARNWHGSGSVPIGRPIPNAPVYILDETLEPVPIGIPGELYISGAGVARGYHGQPGLTAERFIPDPFSDIPGARMYKTGDIVRYLNDGNMIFLGRKDDQVKIRGYRIEPGEIESVLNQMEGISDGLVMVSEDANKDKRLVAYYIPEPGRQPDMASLKDGMKSKLPDYMIPVTYIPVDAFPLTPNGKIDRSALPAPQMDRESLKTPFIAPRSDMEKKMAELWSEVLSVETIGVHDNFFELGGHSLLATRLAARIRDAYGLELPLRVLFEAPTIASLTLQVEKAATLPSATDTQPLRPVSREEQLPLSFSQQRLWFLDQLSPDNPFYNIPIAMKVTGALDLSILEKSTNEIVRRHEVLRTSFHNSEGTPVLQIHDSVKVPITVTDISSMSVSRKQQKIRELIHDEAQKAFRLTSAPLIRIVVIKIAVDEHVIVLNMHHIISDGWSSNIIMKEMALLYDAFRKGHPSPLAELPVQYVDYAAWQRERIKGDVLEEQIRFWKEAIGLNPPVLRLPTDYPRPAAQTFNGDTVDIRLPKELSRGISELNNAQGTTLFMTLLAAFQSLLYHYTHQNEIIVGSPIANRTRSETEDLIGFFVNTLVLKADFENEPTFPALLERTRHFIMDAYTHQDLPFEQLVDELQPTRDMSHSPVFQVMFVLQNTGQLQALDVDLGSIRLEALDDENKTAKFDLTLIVQESEEGLLTQMEYNTDLFKPATVERMLQHYRILLEQVLKQPDLPVSEMSLLSAEESAYILHTLNQTTVDRRETPHIIAAFEEIAEQYPEKTALAFDSQELCYADLNTKANQLAHFLSGKGIGPEKTVAISVNRSMEMVIGLLGILKAGGVYLPIDPSYPEERIRYILRDSGAEFLLTEQQLSDTLFADLQVNRLCLDSDMHQIASYSKQNLPYRSIPENLAYIIYTSGSTGVPKGTMLTHRGLINLTLFQIRDFHLNPASRTLQFASFSFDASISEMFTSLISAGTLYLARPEQLMPGPDLTSQLKKHKISVVTLPPSVSAVIQPESFPDLQTMVTAGESCPADLARHWARNRRFINAYGPTENTVCATSYVYSDGHNHASVPIGTPIENVQIYILDKHLNPVPVGIPGELHIAGESLARGYLHRPDLTAEKFIPNPFSTDPGSRLYKSGDAARYLDDGRIEFLGRMDQQIKIRGFRIEPEEIENLLTSMEKVDDIVVVPYYAGQSDARLIAYYTTSDDDDDLSEQLRHAAHKHLPDYMVPSLFMRLDSMPLTANGKIDRRALPEPDFSAGLTDMEYAAPRNDQEMRLAEIWQNILNIDKIGINDNFFRLGGHSLIATRLLSRINNTFSVNLPLQGIFEHPTIAGISGLLAGPLVHAGFEKPAITSIDRSEEIPLSFAQQRMWFLDQLAPNEPTYNLPSAVKIKGQLDFETLKESINLVALRHEILRTTITDIDGKASQVIHKTPVIRFNYIDLDPLPADEREQEALRIVTQDALQPFDLMNGPLTRVNVVKYAEEHYYFGMTMHHIISDGWSMGILITEMSRNYSLLRHGIQPAPEPLSVQYADYAVWQRNWLKGDILEAEIRFWKERLTGVPPLLNLPLDRPRPAIPSNRGNTITFTLNKSLSDRLKTYSDQQDITLFMTLFAVFNILLQRYSGQDDILTGTPIANRNHHEIEQLIGFFVNTLVLRTDLSENPSFQTLVRRVKQHTLEAYQHQDVPFEMLVDKLVPDREMSHTPLFQVMFVLQNNPVTPQVEESDFRIETVEADTNLAKFDLTVTLMETESGLTGSFEYKTELFDQSSIERMISHFSNLLESAMEHPETPVSGLMIMDAAEQEAVLTASTEGKEIFPVSDCIHQVFEKKAALFANRTALLYEEQTYTYQALNSRANQLARYLNRTGVKQGDLVGLCVERSAEMVISMIAILKAGAAYVSLDPAYPEERLRNIIGNARMPFIILDSSVEKSLPEFSAKRIVLDNEAEKIADEDTTNPGFPVDIADTAYIIYTSGSTGKPKGVMVQHENVVRLFDATDNWYRFDETDVWTFFHSYAFDFSVWELWGALFYGGSVVVIPYLTTRSPHDFYELVCSRKVTVLNQTPSAFRQFIQADQESAITNGTHLRYVIFGGDTLELQSLKPWFLKYGDQKPLLINMYGITETTVHVTYRPLNLKDLHEAPGSVIGTSIPDLQVYVLDGDLQPVPNGIPGELYVGGAGVARGYNGQPDLTAERFIPDPFTEQPGGRLYRTGDLARRLANNDLEYLGRIDHQVQIRGFRVELGEIEHVLTEHDAVQESVVLMREDTPGDKRLVAYLVTDAGKDATVAAIRDFIQDRLPDYMVPSAIVTLEAFPLTAHGKINRKALPVPRVEREDLGTEYIAPTSDKEKVLAETWASILGVEKVGIQDNFFELGGDSILMIQVIARAKAGGIYFTPADVFQNPTIATLTAVSRDDADLLPEQGMISGNVPLTPIQEWFFDHHRDHPEQFNTSMMLELFKPAEPEILEKTFLYLLNHHDALRSRFSKMDGIWQQYIEPSRETMEIQRIDLSGHPGSRQRKEIERLAALAQQDFKLNQVPLLKVIYFDLGSQNSHRLLIIFHHLVLDGVSWRIIIEDLIHIYGNLVQEKEIRLPQKTTSYKKWAEELITYASGPVLETEHDYWKKFSEAASIALPFDFEEGSNTYGDTEDITLSFGIKNTRKLLQEVPQILKTQVNEVLLTALVRTLSPKQKLLVEMEGHGREDIFSGIDLSRTVGWFTSIFPVQLDVSTSRDIKAQIHSIHRQLHEIPYNGIGYNIIKYLSCKHNTEELPGNPQPRINFNYLGQFDHIVPGSGDVPFRVAPERVGNEQHPDEKRACDLYLVIVVSGKELHTRWLYSRKMFKKSTIKKLAGAYLSELKRIIRVVSEG